MSVESTSRNWITVCGQAEPEIEDRLASKLARRLTDKEFTEQDMRVVADLGKNNAQKRLQLSDKKLEKLRRMCQLWDIELRPPHEITSHRKIIGPIIVAAKRLVYPILRVLLKDLIRQQRDFNSSVIAYMVESDE